MTTKTTCKRIRNNLPPSPWLNSSVVITESEKPPKPRWVRGETFIFADDELCVKIPLNDGWFTIVDAKSADLVCNYLWYAHGSIKKKFYVRSSKYSGGSCKTFSIHRFLFGPSSRIVDHKNRNTMDNRMCNIRAATSQQNGVNSPPRFGRKYKGVVSAKNKRKIAWVAQLCGERIGVFDDEQNAAMAYDKRAVERFGDFAWLNFITTTTKRQVVK